MLRSILFLIVLLPLISTAQGWKIFADTSIPFTASYPATWENKIKEGKRVFFTSPTADANDDFRENININVTTNPDFGVVYQIKDMFPAVTEKLKLSFKEFKDEGQTFFKWNNVDACEIRYSGVYKSDTTIRIRNIQWFCFYNTRLYTLTFTALASTSVHTATAIKIMNTIKFKP